ETFSRQIHSLSVVSFTFFCCCCTDGFGFGVVILLSTLSSSSIIIFEDASDIDCKDSLSIELIMVGKEAVSSPVPVSVSVEILILSKLLEIGSPFLASFKLP